MIRTAILAGILLVMLSMAYSRPGAVPSLVREAAQPAEDHEEIAQEEPAPVRAATPRAVAAAKVEEPEEELEPAITVEDEAPVDEPQVAVAPVAPLPPVMPAREEPRSGPVAAEPGRPISLLPPSMTAAREPARIEPLVSDDMPALAAPQMPPSQEMAAAPAAPPAPLPEVHVPTRPVMAPSDLASRLPAPGVTPDAVEPALEARVTAASGPKYMTPQERSRELYRLAREMEDTFIQKMTQ